jgi:hypothetical protein
VPARGALGTNDATGIADSNRATSLDRARPTRQARAWLRQRIAVGSRLGLIVSKAIERILQCFRVGIGRGELQRDTKCRRGAGVGDDAKARSSNVVESIS